MVEDYTRLMGTGEPSVTKLSGEIMYDLLSTGTFGLLLG